ncbi:hypothetical protein E3V55_01365 [Candidatus Marinimicrobia bacterium MT.SAG.3]|nr:hypothetical protein E3V55_01365 [Candidatus Marinimicrobia bacterium MT.SAG.3]
MPQFSKRHLFTTFLILIIPSLLYAQGRIIHSPPAGVEIGKEVEIFVSVENSSAPVTELKVLYRQRGSQSYKEFSMFESSGFWSAVIPASEVTDAGLEYLIIAELQGGGQLAYPENNPYDQPVFIPTLIVKAAELQEAAQMQGAVAGSNMIILSPEPNSRTKVEETLIAVSLFYNDDIDLSSIAIYLNGINITGSSIISEELITYASDDLDPGLKTVIIEASDLSGEPLVPLQWDFTVVSDKVRTESRFKISGKAVVDSRGDKIQGVTDDVTTSRLSFRGNYDFVNYKGLAYLTSKENEFLQPKNRFMFGLNTKYLTVNFGDLNPNVTPLTIYGKRIRGVEGILDLGYFNLHAVYGELEREIPADIMPKSEVLTDENGNRVWDKAEAFDDFGIDSIAGTGDLGEGNGVYDLGEPFTDLDGNGVWNGDEKFDDFGKDGIKNTGDSGEGNGVWDGVGKVFRGGTFSRNLLAMRASFGPNRRFQWGFTFAQARDDSLIATNLPDRVGLNLQSGRPAVFDYLSSDAPDGEKIEVILGHAPKDNMLLGTDLFYGIDNNRIILEGEAAFSLLARDITGGPFTKDNLDTLLDDDFDGKIDGRDIPIDPGDYEKIFILNQTMIPLDPRGLNSLTYNAGLKMSYFKNFLRANYRFVGSEYNSLANPFIRKDIKGFDISDRIRMINSKFIVSLRFERLENNLAEDKENTTTTTSFDGGISLYPGRDMPRISLNVRNIIRDNSVDTTRIDDLLGYIDRRLNNATVTSTFSIGYDVEALGLKHRLNLNVSNSESKDEFEQERLNEKFEDDNLNGRRDPNENFTDENEDGKYNSFSSSNNTSAAIALVVNTEYNFPLKTQVQFLTNNNKSELSEFGYTFFGVGGKYLMFADKLEINGNLKYTSTSGTIEFNETRLGGGARYYITPKQSILASAEFKKRVQPEKTFNDYIVRARYSISF